MSRERPANTKETARSSQPMPSKGNIKNTNAANPLLHTHKDAANFGKTTGGKGQQTKQKTGTSGSKGSTRSTGSTSSITFGQIRFDQNTHLLYVDAKKGGDQIRCSITQDALCGCFDTAPNFDAMQTCFKAHTGEISQALENKWQAGKWKIPSKEICLEERDIREHLKK